MNPVPEGWSQMSDGKPALRIATREIEVKSARRTEFIDITKEVEQLVADSRVRQGVCHLYVPHTTAGILINEHDDPDVARDMEAMLDRLVPREGSYRHAEGNSDAHIKTSLIGVSETVWIESGRLSLGRWQGVFFCEFDGPRRREVRVKIVPDREA